MTFHAHKHIKQPLLISAIACAYSAVVAYFYGYWFSQGLA